jgi:hypothetical protein
MKASCPLIKDSLQLHVQQGGAVTSTAIFIMLDSGGNYKYTVSINRDAGIYYMDNQNILYATKNNSLMGLFIYDMESNTTKTVKSGRVFDFATLTEDSVIYSGRDENGIAVLKKIDIEMNS